MSSSIRHLAWCSRRTLRQSISHGKLVYPRRPRNSQSLLHGTLLKLLLGTVFFCALDIKHVLAMVSQIRSFTLLETSFWNVRCFPRQSKSSVYRICKGAANCVVDNRSECYVSSNPSTNPSDHGFKTSFISVSFKVHHEPFALNTPIFNCNVVVGIHPTTEIDKIDKTA